MSIRDKANENSKAEDLKYINAAINGDQGAFACLMKKYRGLIRNLIFKMVSDKEILKI